MDQNNNLNGQFGQNNEQDKKDVNEVLFDPNKSENRKRRIFAEEVEVPVRQKKKPKRKKRIVTGAILTILVICVSVMISAVIITFATDYMGIGGSSNEIEFEVESGATQEEIIAELEDRGIIQSAFFFEIFLTLSGSEFELEEGTHTLTNAMTYSTIINSLTSTVSSSGTEIERLTFVEGTTLQQAAQMLEDNNICSAEEFLTAFNESTGAYDFESEVPSDPLKFNQFEGYLFPDTYDFYIGSNPDVVVSRLRQVFAQKIYANYTEQINASQFTLDEVITLASIVQAEAANYEDMQMVASVFLNRINNSDIYPKLESDPTTNFVEEIIMPNIEVDNEEMFTAYDTYKGNGLPPGAICNPGEDAIKAVLNAAETEYFYFCANIDTGEIYYAQTLAEHEQNLVLANLV